MTESTIERAVYRLKYIEKHMEEGCDDQLGEWGYPEIGVVFFFHNLEPDYVGFIAIMTDNDDEPVAIMIFRAKQEDFGDFIEDFESGVYPHLKPDPITP